MIRLKTRYLNKDLAGGHMSLRLRGKKKSNYFFIPIWNCPNYFFSNPQRDGCENQDDSVADSEGCVASKCPRPLSQSPSLKEMM